MRRLDHFLCHENSDVFIYQEVSGGDGRDQLRRLHFEAVFYHFDCELDLLVAGRGHQNDCLYLLRSQK